MSLKKNTLWNIFGMGVPLLVGVVAIPYLLQRIGVELLGILTIAWALIGYFSLFDLGLGRALTQQLSVCRANQDETKVPELVKSGLLFAGWSGIFGGLFLALTAHSLAGWLNISINLRHDAFIALLISAVGVPLTAVTSGLRGILEAYEEFRAVNILRMSLGLANFGLPVICVMLFGASLSWMIGSLVAARLLVLIAHYWVADLKLPTGWQGAKFNREQFKKLFSFGAWMTVSNVVSPLMVTADRFIISAALGASVVAYYTVPAEILFRILVLPAALTAALFPRLASDAVVAPQIARLLYRRFLKIVLWAVLPICLLVAVSARWGLAWWLSPEFASYAWPIASIMTLGIFFNSIAFVPFAAIQALGYASFTAKLHVIELVIYIPLLLIGLHFHGLIGAAIAWVVRVLFDMVVLLLAVERYGLGVPHARAN